MAKADDEARGWRTLEERLGVFSPCDETFADSEPAIHVIRKRSQLFLVTGTLLLAQRLCGSDLEVTRAGLVEALR